MKKIIFLFFIIAYSNIFSQNTSTLKKYAIRDAKEMTQASISQDANILLKYTHPHVIKKYGERKMLETTNDIFRTMKAQKIKIISSKINGVTEIKKEHKEYRCLVKNTVVMSFSGRPVTIKSSLFGFYDKKKEHWYFVESNKLLDDEETKTLFPNFETSIEIPIDEHISDSK